MNLRVESVKVEDALPADSGRIRQIAIDAEIDAWSEADYRAEISRSDSFVLKASVDGQIAGFLLARAVSGTEDSHDADLYNIAVSRSHMREGIGSKLLKILLHRLEDLSTRNLWLEVRESNSVARRFYENSGFVAELTRPNFYSDPVENAVIMRLRLQDKTYLSEL